MQLNKKAETLLLNFYAVNERLAGLALGKMALREQDAHIKQHLIQHYLEEIRHAELWSNAMQQLGLSLIEVHEKGKQGFWSFVREAKSLPAFLSRIHLIELRFPLHLEIHAQYTNEPGIKKLCHQLIQEEGSHLSWIKSVLLDAAAQGVPVQEYLGEAYEKEKEYYVRDITRFHELAGIEADAFVQALMGKVPVFERQFHGYLNDYLSKGLHNHKL